jgi:hypothetical protein
VAFRGAVGGRDGHGRRLRIGLEHARDAEVAQLHSVLDQENILRLDIAMLDRIASSSGGRFIQIIDRSGGIRHVLQ